MGNEGKGKKNRKGRGTMARKGAGNRSKNLEPDSTMKSWETLTRMEQPCMRMKPDGVLGKRTGGYGYSAPGNRPILQWINREVHL